MLIPARQLFLGSESLGIWLCQGGKAVQAITAESGIASVADPVAVEAETIGKYGPGVFVKRPFLVVSLHAQQTEILLHVGVETGFEDRCVSSFRKRNDLLLSEHEVFVVGMDALEPDDLLCKDFIEVRCCDGELMWVERVETDL